MSLTTSDNLDELGGALAAAQGLISGALKDSNNPHLRSSFASLASCWDAVRGPLSSHGLAVVQGVGHVDGVLYCTTRLIHSSGQWTESTLRMGVDVPKGLNYAQAIGSVTTYLRRYGLCAMVGIAPLDTDGDTGKPTRPSRSAPQGRGKAKTSQRAPKASKAPDVKPRVPNPDHDKDWETDRAGFMQAIKDLSWGYSELCDMLAMHEAARPSRLSQQERRDLFKDLRSGGWDVRIRDWRAEIGQ